MGIKSLEKLLSPGRIAVCFHKDTPQEIEKKFFYNVIGSNFKGSIYPVDPDREAVCGIPAYSAVRDLPKKPDLAVLTAPPKALPGVLRQCAKAGIPSAVIFSSDFMHRTEKPHKLIKEMTDICSRYSIRCIGPNSLGFIRPGLGINISLALARPPKGKIAFLSQSGTLASAILDFAQSKNVGFSTFVSLGGQMDVDFADLIDFLGIDPETRGIILYVESVKDARRFLGAARSFARSKPIVVIKAGKFAQSARLSLSRIGALAGEDAVFDAVFKRAAMVRVDNVLDLFNTSEALSKQATPKDKSITIVTNAGGPAVLAIDTLIKQGGDLAEFSDDTKKALREIMPPHCIIGNPLDVLSDAPAERFAKALEICLGDRDANAVLAILSHQLLCQPTRTARMLVQIAELYPYRTILACWMGSGDMDEGRRILNENGIPTFATPEQAVKSFMYMWNYQENVRLLSETPSNILMDFQPDKEKAVSIMQNVLKEGRLFLLEREAKEVFATYGIKSPPMKLARTAEQALEIGREFGFPVALKVESPDVPHKNEAGGVFLHVLENEVQDVFLQIERNLRNFNPSARFNGVTVQPMILWPGYEFAIAAKKDPTFGAVIVFGLGGQLLGPEKDYAVGIPPLNQTLARRLMEDTRICRHLFSEKKRRPRMEQLENALVRFSILVADFPQLKEIDINPFYLGKEEGICLDGRMVLEEEALEGFYSHQGATCPEHMVICPYPCHYIDSTRMKDGTPYMIRPIKPEDEPLMEELFYTFSEQTVRNRFFHYKKDISHEELARYCQIDYDREIALVASIEDNAREKIIGVSRLTIMPSGQSAELAVVVGDPWQSQGIGKRLMANALKIARERGIREIWMDVLAGNKAMNRLSKRMGFKKAPSEDPDIVRYVLKLKK